MAQKLSEKRVREALAEFRGNYSAAAQSLGVSRGAVQQYVKARPDLIRLTQELRDSRVDHAEDKLWTAVERGDVAAIRYTLTCLGRDRGWVEKPPEETAGHLHVHLSEGELVRRLQALAAQLGRREPQQISAPSEPAGTVAIVVTDAESQTDQTTSPAPAEPPAEKPAPSTEGTARLPAPVPATPVVGVPGDQFDE